jgi:NAD(P)-dependent dehydrogenase (short-subunit alcohol dehydrogenase family)
MGQFHRGPMAGRTVLITGGTAGIGRATALGLAAMGAHLAITGRDRGRAESAAREIRAAGGAEDPGRVQRLFTPFMRPFMKTPAQGAATSVHLASAPAPALEQMTGRYFASSKPEDPPSAATTRSLRHGSGT